MFFKNLYQYRELLLQLVARQIKTRYKQSVLGILWAILNPLFMMIIFTVIFSYFIRIPSDGIPYPLFSYCALLSWQFFSGSVSSATSSLTGNSSLVQQIYFPREIFPISSIIASFVDFLIASSIFVLMLVFYKVHITPYAFFAILLIVLQFLLIAGVSFLGSALNVFYRDVGFALNFLLQIWMYATPVIYPLSVVPEKLLPFYLLNPMVGIIDGYRRVVIQGIPPNWHYLAISAAVSFVLLLFSYWYFKKRESRFADVI